MTTTISVGNTYFSIEQIYGLITGGKDIQSKSDNWVKFYDFILNLLNVIPNVELKTRQYILSKFNNDDDLNSTPEIFFEKWLKPLFELINTNESKNFFIEFDESEEDELTLRIIYNNQGKEEISEWIKFDNTDDNKNQIKALQQVYFSSINNSLTSSNRDTYCINERMLSSSKK
ncbi:MAG: hypothetical protein ACMZI0_07235 [Symbiopectobacterium sp.]|uniref:hypothetical protein n=1 Tax=Symbiopectobacterium sp. TaxID=2952789 RepID=UPI0039E921D3